MAARAGFFLIILLLTKPIEREEPARWITWNVGQGQWLTHINSDGCWHFDMGGERAPWRELMHHCRTRKNHVFFSHWDLDHINFAGRAKYFLPNLCRFEMPGGSPSAGKRRMVSRIPLCENPTPFKFWRPKEDTLNRKPTSNEYSGVVFWRRLLIPGDSNKAMEKYWLSEMEGLPQTRVLILGHHGSRTSTSLELIKTIRDTKLAIASARRKRYKHPHVDVERLLRMNRIPLLSTEDWGHIHIMD